MEHVVQSSIPSKESALLGIESSNTTKAQAFTKAFLKNSLPQMKDAAIDDMMLRKAVVLEFKRPKKKGKKSKAKGLNAKERRQLKIFQLKPEHQKYELFLPLHELWKQYIEDLCNGLKPESNPQMIQQKLLKADFHGAVLTVVRSKCPSYVGLTGILVQEMKHIFKIITKEDKLKVISHLSELSFPNEPENKVSSTDVIPKRNSVFSMEIGDFVTHIYGSKFELRSSERSAKKFKVKGTIDL